MSLDPPTLAAEKGNGAEIRTFLIADVRGYTSFTNEFGDEAAARLAGKFAAIVRHGVQTRGGTLVELRGDEGLAVFSSARQAIRAAMDLQAAFVEATLADPTLPLLVGIGMDAGEAVPVEGGYRGGALNLAARLCSRADRGHTLASAEVVHLARRVEGVKYVELGAVRFKGLDQPVPVVRIMLEHEDPALRLAHLDLTRPAVRRRPSGRVRSLVAAGAVLAVIVAVAIPLLRHRGTAAAPLSADGVQIIDTASGRSVGDVPLAFAPAGLASGAGSVWASDPQDGTVVRVDPGTHAVVDTIQVGPNPSGVAFGDGAVWAAVSGAGQLDRIDPTTDTVVHRINVGNGPTGVAVAAGSVWTTDYDDDTVVRIDIATDQVVSRVAVGSEPVAVAANASGAWVADSGDGTITQVPLDGGTTPIRVGNGPSSVAIGPTGVWVTNSLDGTLSRINANTGVMVQTTPIGNGPSAVTTDAQTVWVADHFGSEIARIDASSYAPRSPVRMNAEPVAMTPVGSQLWVAASATPSVHRGGTLRFATSEVPDSIDPAVAYSAAAWQILPLTNDGLIGFDRVGGPESAARVPDLATSIPTPTDGGRTYTFQIRPGIHYSTGAVVTPEDFRRGIERTLVNRLPYGIWMYYRSIVGAKGCVSVASCDLDKGIVTNAAARTVTFHLRSPDPSFLYALALPAADAVPAGTPMHTIDTKPLPATGPYEISAYKDGSRRTIDLVRNPHFREWSQAAQPDGYPNQILGTYNISPSRQVSGVERGQLDVTDDNPPANVLARLDTTYPGQLRDASPPATYGFVLNDHVRPFNHIDVRRALNYAVNRTRLVDLAGGSQLAQVSCQILPPQFPGYQRYCPYTLDPNKSGSWTAPNLPKAERLVDASGTRGTPVTVWVPRNQWEPDARYITSVLRTLGYQAKLRVLSASNFFGVVDSPKALPHVQISFLGWSSDFPSPSYYLDSLFACNSSSNEWHFCNPRVQQQMRTAQAVQASDPAASDVDWARVDRSIVDQAPWVALPAQHRIYLLSKRTGNLQVSVQWGLLLSQLWTQ